METTPHAIYVHWPFCKAKCPYCDFNSHVREAVDQAAWRAALVREIAHWGQVMPGRVGSVFFGGGTPSLMPVETVEAVLEAIGRAWTMEPDVEITLEANPTSADQTRFEGYRAAGVNRLSLGVQSLRAEALKALGREHNVAEAKVAMGMARSIFPRFSFDLIYTREGQRFEEWEEELEEALALAGGHLSLYQLTIEPGTQFFHRHASGALTLPEDEASTRMFEHTHARLAAHGMPAYEISNFAILGQESRHNNAYWKGEAYIGIGPGAHGRPEIAGARHATQNLRSPEKWLAAVEAAGHGLEPGFPEMLDAASAAEERLLMGLRLREGIEAARFMRQTGQTLESFVDSAAMEWLQAEGFVTYNGQHLRATPRGWPLVNAITAKLLGA